jgi:hypothetical protein
MELWNTRNQMQQRLESQRGFSALDKREKVKVSNHQAAHRTSTGSHKAVNREATITGKVHGPTPERPWKGDCEVLRGN